MLFCTIRQQLYFHSEQQPTLICSTSIARAVKTCWLEILFISKAQFSQWKHAGHLFMPAYGYYLIVYVQPPSTVNCQINSSLRKASLLNNSPAARSLNAQAALSNNSPAARSLNAQTSLSNNSPAARSLNTQTALSNNSPATRSLNTQAALSNNSPAARSLNAQAALSNNSPAARSLNAQAARSNNSPAARSLNAQAARSNNEHAAGSLKQGIRGQLKTLSIQARDIQKSCSSESGDILTKVLHYYVRHDS